MARNRYSRVSISYLGQLGEFGPKLREQNLDPKKHFCSVAPPTRETACQSTPPGLRRHVDGRAERKAATPL